MYPDRELIAGIIEKKKYKRRVRTDFKSPYFFCGMFGTDNETLIAEYQKLEENRQFYDVFWQGLGLITAISGTMTLLLAVLKGGVPEKILSILFSGSAILTVILVMVYNRQKNIVDSKLVQIEAEIVRDYEILQSEEDMKSKECEGGGDA